MEPQCLPAASATLTQCQPSLTGPGLGLGLAWFFSALSSWPASFMHCPLRNKGCCHPPQTVPLRAHLLSPTSLGLWDLTSVDRRKEAPDWLVGEGEEMEPEMG